MKPAENYLSPLAQQEMRAAIAAAGGNEVFFSCELGDDLLVSSATALAHGHATAVPAVLHHFESMQVSGRGRIAIHNHPSGRLEPSEADLQISSFLAEMGVGSLIVDNAVTRVWPVVEPIAPRQTTRIDEGTISEIFAPGGALARALDDYEERPTQTRMAQSVAAAFNERSLLLVEAGTGTGKSVAYLAPAIAWSVANGERVIVSTNTINLQDQLIEKDLPVLKKALPWAFDAVVMKGRNNYVGKRKAARLREGGLALLEGEVEEQTVSALFSWIDRTTTGDRRELDFEVPGTLWNRVASEADNCLRTQCPSHASCFYYQARRRAAAANVVVVNHSLLFTDLALRTRLSNFEQGLVLPPAKHIIMDEAHHTEDVAARCFGVEVTRAGTLQLLGRLVSARDPRRGALPYLLARVPALAEHIGYVEAGALSAHLKREVIPAVEFARGELRSHFAAIDDAIVRLAPVAKQSSRAGRKTTVRLAAEIVGLPEYGRLHSESQRIREVLGELGKILRSVVHRLEDVERPDPRIRGEVVELGSLASRVLGVLSSLAIVVPDPTDKWDESRARWVERAAGEKGPSITLAAAPVDVSGLLGDALHDRHATVVFTSATLSVRSSFTHVSARLGLMGDAERQQRVRESVLPSPFDYPRNCLLAVVSDVQELDAPNALARQADILFAALQASGGHAFCLCTSYGALDGLYSLIETRAIAAGMTLLAQRGGNRSQLLENFRRLPRPVLFGTDSFWEGVDVRGDALRLVAIQRLPFRPPFEPLEAARTDSLRAGGKDAFATYSLPQAILRMKQGFGRLIRTGTDRGVVLVLDGRMAARSYGREFLEALPPARTFLGTGQQSVEQIRAFFKGPGGLPAGDGLECRPMSAELPESGNPRA